VRLASELPFALWAVYLGAALIEDRHAAFLLLGCLVILLRTCF